MAIIASEPLTDEAWEELPEGYGVLIKPNLEVEITDFKLGDLAQVVCSDETVEQSWSQSRATPAA
jgi:hypothetical protein